MSERPIIKISNLSKQYRIGARQQSYDTLRDALASAARAPFKRWRANGSGKGELIWALKDFNLEIQPGEAIGIIGNNGAGKSTLLKILSRITEPTTGRVEIYGRIGSLLEVGTGFHPELTGRENIFLNGAILGMRRREIERKFDEIVAFSGIEKFLDTPVKYYSSGMYMRLAFAVAAHLDPEILLVDEVLAVGDAEFQAKCLGKMNDVARQGRTVVFVSHNMAAIESLCNRVLWLAEGKIVKEGPVDRVVRSYLGKRSEVSTEKVWEDISDAPGNDRVRIRKVSIRPSEGQVGDDINIQTPFVMEFEYWNLAPGLRLNLSLVLHNEHGVVVFNTFPTKEPDWHGKPFPAGLFRSSCHVPGDLLNDGMHRLSLYVVEDQGNVLFVLDDIVAFNVLDSIARRGGWHGKWTGAVRPDLIWETERLTEALPLAIQSPNDPQSV